MSVFIFDGKDFAQKKEKVLIYRAQKLKDKGITPKIVSIVVGDTAGAMMYQRMKQKAAERVGCELSIISFQSSSTLDEIIDRISELNNDSSIHGIMLQLPLPHNFSGEDKDAIIDFILPQKDVDGMREDSSFVTPVVKAITQILDEADKTVRRPCRIGLPRGSSTYIVVGADGFVGRKLILQMKLNGYTNVVGVDIDTKDLKSETLKADIIISTVGVSDLITSSMVRENAVLIDVGAPKGDIARDTYKKASFVSPVPGGVGPVTISCLLENLVSAAEKDL